MICSQAAQNNNEVRSVLLLNFSQYLTKEKLYYAKNMEDAFGNQMRGARTQMLYLAQEVKLRPVDQASLYKLVSVHTIINWSHRKYNKHNLEDVSGTGKDNNNNIV